MAYPLGPPLAVVADGCGGGEGRPRGEGSEREDAREKREGRKGVRRMRRRLGNEENRG